MTTDAAFAAPDARPPLRVLLAAPRGFCAGVSRAIEIVEAALAQYGPPVFVRHEIVHNAHVVESLRRRGAVFVDELDEAPDDRPVIFSAHGVPRAVPAEAARRNMTYIDATCPLVSKVHAEARRHAAAGRHVFLVGHDGHPEVVGTFGQLPAGAASLVETAADARRAAAPDPAQVAYVTQTTLSVDDTAEIVDILRARFPAIAEPARGDICYATTNRQEAVKALARRADAVIVIGAENSSNSRRLAETARAAGCALALLAADAGSIDWAALGAPRVLGLTAGASAPEHLVQDVLGALRARFDVAVETVRTAEENVVFRLPRLRAS